MSRRGDMPSPLRLSSTHRRGILVLWLGLVACIWLYLAGTGMSVRDGVQYLVRLLRSPFGPLVYLIFFAVRPLLLVPSSWLMVAAGAVFGPIGILYALSGYNLAAVGAYALGDWFVRGIDLPAQRELPLHSYAERLRRRGFETVLMLRLLFLPMDIDSYAAGTFKIPLYTFLPATILGSIPGVITCVLIGTSITLETTGTVLVSRFDPRLLILSAIVLLMSLAGSRYVRKRAAGNHDDPSRNA